MTGNKPYTVPVYKGKPLTEFSRLSDVWIKYVLASPWHKRCLLDLLNGLFEEECPPCMKPGEKVTDVSYPDRETVKEHQNERGAVLDILVETSEGQLVNIEIYQYLRPGIKDKALFNFARLFTSSSRQGGELLPRDCREGGELTGRAGAGKLKPVIVINLLSKELFREYGDEFVHPCALLHRHHPEVPVSDKLYLYFIEVTKCPEERTQRRLLRWLQYFNNRSVPGPGALEYTEDDPIFAELESMEMDFVADYDNLRRYFDHEEQARVDAMLMNEALSKVKAEGVLESRFDIARNLFKLGLSQAQIKESTGLSDTLLEKAQRDENLTEEEIASAMA